jgi:hypothetical protein
VTIAGAFREHRGEQIDIRAHGVRSTAKARGKALREIARRGVKRAIQTAVVPLEHIAVGGGSLRPDIDDVESALWRDVETEFERWHRGL